MGRAPCCDKANVKRGPWSPEEDAKLKDFIHKYGTAGNWIALPQKAGLKRCGKSCRLRWLNYLRPNIKHGDFSDEEDRVICSLYVTIGSRWSIIASQLPGRTDNDIKNYWNTKLKKKLMGLIIPNNSSNNQKKSPYFPYTLEAQQNLLYTQQNILYTNNNNSNIMMTTNFPNYNYPELKDNSNLLMFGEASCTSSDGTFGNDIIKREEIMSSDYYLQGQTISSGAAAAAVAAIEEINHNLNLDYFGNMQQLTTSCCTDGNNGSTSSNSLLLFNDENCDKSNETGMFYY